MKTCVSCKEELTHEEFHKRTKALDGLQANCKKCNREQRKAYYKTAHGKEKNSTTGKRWKIQLRSKAYKYLATHPCIDCGESDPIVLEFDHRDPADKIMAVSTMIDSGLGWSRVLDEINKCDVRCSNCHKRRTAKQFGWYSWAEHL